MLDPWWLDLSRLLDEESQGLKTETTKLLEESVGHWFPDVVLGEALDLPLKAKVTKVKETNGNHIKRRHLAQGRNNQQRKRQPTSWEKHFANPNVMCQLHLNTKNQKPKK